MYRCNLVICFLGSVVFGDAAAMKTIQKPQIKLVSEVLFSEPGRSWLPRSRIPVKHVKILKVEDIFKNIVKRQDKSPNKDIMMLMILDNRKKKIRHLDESKETQYIGQTQLALGIKNKIILNVRKPKHFTRRRHFNGTLRRTSKRNDPNKKFGEKCLRKARRSNKNNRRLYNQGNGKVLAEKKEDEMYGEVKRKTARTKRIDVFMRPTRNKEQGRKRKLLDRRTSKKLLGRKGSFIQVFSNGDRQEPQHIHNGGMVNSEGTTMNNKMRGLYHLSDDNTNDELNKLDFTVGTTFNGFKRTDILTYATSTRTKILSGQESHIISNELYQSNNESESSGSSLRATTSEPKNVLTNSQDDIKSNNEIQQVGNTEERTDDTITTTWDSRLPVPMELLPKQEGNTGETTPHIKTTTTLDNKLLESMESLPIQSTNTGEGTLDIKTKTWDSRLLEPMEFMPIWDGNAMETTPDIITTRDNRHLEPMALLPRQDGNTGETTPDIITTRDNRQLVFMALLPIQDGNTVETTPDIITTRDNRHLEPMTLLPIQDGNTGETTPDIITTRDNRHLEPMALLPIQDGNTGETTPDIITTRDNRHPEPMVLLPIQDGKTVERTSDIITTTWDTRNLEPMKYLPSRAISWKSRMNTQMELQPEQRESTVDDQTILHPIYSILELESSGDSSVQVELLHNNGTLHVIETTPVTSTDSTLLYPTSNKHPNITIPETGGNEEVHDSVFSPLEMVMNYGSETTYCKPGYKYYAGVCKSMCDMGDFYCENGGECVIVEKMGAMCRCHQTNNLCYKGECCRLSLTPFQLICVIGSCCIFVSVFLGSISLLIRRMDIKAVSKSVRTRLWISTLMPDSRSSSFSRSVDSEFTACSECDSSDLPFV